MASELSRFIEDELKKQGIQDDEEQRLLSNLRVKPLAVQAPAATTAQPWGNKQRLVFAGCLLVAFIGLVALITTVRGHHLQSGWAMTEPETGAAVLGERKKESEQEAGQPSPGKQGEEEVDDDYDEELEKEIEEELEKEQGTIVDPEDEKKEPEAPKSPEGEKPKEDSKTEEEEEEDYEEELEKELEEEAKAEEEAEEAKEAATAPASPAPGGRRRRRLLLAA